MARFYANRAEPPFNLQLNLGHPPDGWREPCATIVNSYCPRTAKASCRLDYLIPLNERHLKCILREFITHYNRGRPHSALGPGFPEPIQATVPASGHRHRLPPGHRVAQTPVLGGLHHEYRLEQDVA